MFFGLQFQCSGSCSSRFFFIYSNDVLFQWLANFVARFGDVLWHKLEAVQRGYEMLGYIGKRLIIQKSEETFEYRDIINHLAELGGHMEINEE